MMSPELRGEDGFGLPGSGVCFYDHCANFMGAGSWGAILTHELAHALGASHNNMAGHLMNPVQNVPNPVDAEGNPSKAYYCAPPKVTDTDVMNMCASMETKFPNPTSPSEPKETKWDKMRDCIEKETTTYDELIEVQCTKASSATLNIEILSGVENGLLDQRDVLRAQLKAACDALELWIDEQFAFFEEFVVLWDIRNNPPHVTLKGKQVGIFKSRFAWFKGYSGTGFTDVMESSGADPDWRDGNTTDDQFIQALDALRPKVSTTSQKLKNAYDKLMTPKDAAAAAIAEVQAQINAVRAAIKIEETKLQDAESTKTMLKTTKETKINDCKKNFGIGTY